MALLPAIVENYENHRSLVFRLLKDNAGITKEVLELHG